MSKAGDRHRARKKRARDLKRHREMARRIDGWYTYFAIMDSSVRPFHKTFHDVMDSLAKFDTFPPLVIPPSLARRRIGLEFLEKTDD